MNTRTCSRALAVAAALGLAMSPMVLTPDAALADHKRGHPKTTRKVYRRTVEDRTYTNRGRRVRRRHYGYTQRVEHRNQGVRRRVRSGWHRHYGRHRHGNRWHTGWYRHHGRLHR